MRRHTIVSYFVGQSISISFLPPLTSSQRKSNGYARLPIKANQEDAYKIYMGYNYSNNVTWMVAIG